MFETVQDRFNAKYTVDEDTGCWDWCAGINKWGYGKFWVDGKTERAHRVSYALHTGEVPPDMLVLHSCHNRSCVNPDHLRLGSHKENMKDMVTANRQDRPKGMAHPGVKLSDKEVLEIRQLLSVGELNQTEISKIYNVCNSIICGIHNGRGWQHI